MNGKSEAVKAAAPVAVQAPAPVVALPDLVAIKGRVESDLKALFEAQGAKDWSPGLGLAITGLRSALHGLAGHEQQKSASAK